MRVWNKWKQICDKYNKNIDSLNQDNSCDYAMFPTIIITLFVWAVIAYLTTR